MWWLRPPCGTAGRERTHRGQRTRAQGAENTDRAGIRAGARHRVQPCWEWAGSFQGTCLLPGFRGCGRCSHPLTTHPLTGDLGHASHQSLELRGQPVSTQQSVGRSVSPRALPGTIACSCPAPQPWRPGSGSDGHQHTGLPQSPRQSCCCR